MKRRVLSAVFLLAALAPRASACAVCFGDPESPLARGALVGMSVLLAVTAFVLGGVAFVGGYWIVRARRIASQPGST